MLGPINNYPPQKSCLRTPFNQKQKVFWVISLFMPGNIVICTFLGLKSKMAILARTIAPSNFQWCYFCSQCAKMVGQVSTFSFYCVRFRCYNALKERGFSRNVLFQHSKPKLPFPAKTQVPASSRCVILVLHSRFSGGRHQLCLSTVYGLGAMTCANMPKYGRYHGYGQNTIGHSS